MVPIITVTLNPAIGISGVGNEFLSGILSWLSPALHQPDSHTYSNAFSKVPAGRHRELFPPGAIVLQKTKPSGARVSRSP
jgi:hypothetical protein